MTNDEIRALLEGATPGPWEVEDNGWVSAVDEPVCMIESGGFTGVFRHAETDARLIASAPSLAAEVLRLREVLRDLLDDTQHVNHDCGDAEWCPVIRARAALKGAAQ